MAYGTVILVSWLAFFLVWGIGAFNVKRDIGPASNRWRYLALRAGFITLVLLLFAAHGGNIDKAIMHTGLFTPGPLVGWVAAVLSVAGIAFAIWARVHLGRNWSSRPTAKEKHELVTSGPYALVRHPIYTGLILASIGAFLTGAVFGIVAVVAAPAVFLLRIGREERIMRTLFPEQYPAYRARTKRLIPFVW